MHLWHLAHDRVHVDQKKGAQLPPLRTTLLAPDPEDPTSTILELDERMARLCSKFNVLVKTHVCFHQDASQAPLHCTQVPKLSTNLTLAIQGCKCVLSCVL